nr:hypothetical protein [Tanacetum cinerariifolium]
MLSLSSDLGVKDYRNEKIDIRFRRECEDTIDELKGKFNGMSIEINKRTELQYLEQVANVSASSSQRFKSFCCDNHDYDYDESTIPLNEIISQEPLSNTITPILLTMEPKDSLIIGNEEFSTIPEKESNELIKSSVEDLTPILSESEDTSGSNSECVLPSCDDFSPINIFEEKSVTFSNPLFNLNDDFTSSDDESLSDEDVSDDNFKIYLNPLFDFDDEYISSDVNPLFDKVLKDIECKDYYESILDESTFLVTPLFDSNEDEFFALGDDIDLLLHHDPSIPKMSVVSILKRFTDEPPLEENDELFDLESNKNEWKKDFGDVLYLEKLISDNETPNSPPEVFLDRDTRSLSDNDDLKIMVKVFDPEIHKNLFSQTYVSLSFKDWRYLFFTYVIRILLPYFTYPVNSPFLLSSGKETLSFIRELGHSIEIKFTTDVSFDHLHQPWRAFAVIIKKCLSRKEDLAYQINNKDSKKQDKMYYPRFTNVIIHHFLTKDKSILMRNRTFMHTTRDDNLLGTMRFISRHEETQVYGALLPKAMKNQAMLDSDSYKTSYAIATGNKPPKPKKTQMKSDSAFHLMNI